jgi:hypothetical protein
MSGCCAYRGLIGAEVKPPRRTASIVTGAVVVALLLCWAPASQATVFSASASDPAGDLGIYGGELPDPPVDFTSVSVEYDDVAGHVQVSFGFAQTPAAHSELHAGVGLGSLRPDGSCSAPIFTSLVWHLESPDSSPRGEVAVEGHSTNFAGRVTGTLWEHSPTDVQTWEGASLFKWPGSPKRTFTFATTRSSLIGRHYNCAFAGMWVQDSNGVGEEALDGVLELTSAVPSPPPAGGGTTPPPPPPPPTTGSGSQSSPSLTGRRARRALNRALARRYGRVFRRRTAFTASCVKTSDSRWRCAVRWRYRDAIYKGKVTVRLRADGTIATRVALRKIVP